MSDYWFYRWLTFNHIVGKSYSFSQVSSLQALPCVIKPQSCLSLTVWAILRLACKASVYLTKYRFLIPQPCLAIDVTLQAVLGDEFPEKCFTFDLRIRSNQITKTLLVLIFVDILTKHICDKAVVSESNVHCNLLSVEGSPITHKFLCENSLKLAKLLRMRNRTWLPIIQWDSLVDERLQFFFNLGFLFCLKISQHWQDFTVVFVALQLNCLGDDIIGVLWRLLFARHYLFFLLHDELVHSCVFCFVDGVLVLIPILALEPIVALLHSLIHLFQLRD